VTSKRWRILLLERSEWAGVEVSDGAIEELGRYFELIAKWNATINLTALPLEPPTATTVDRLFIEPLAAARVFPRGPLVWFDVGSGGGSPAIPLKILYPEASLTMVETKARKAAFLREAVRLLALSQAFVENARFEVTAEARPASTQLVTSRAVKLDEVFASSACRLLSSRGQLLAFRSTSRVHLIEGMTHRETIELLPNGRSFLSIYAKG
jgi:16S rRNA (guanine527-N7)-methyltransferase